MSFYKDIYNLDLKLYIILLLYKFLLILFKEKTVPLI
jgi:hypothetical protein